jgi:Zn-dependent protease
MGYMGDLFIYKLISGQPGDLWQYLSHVGIVMFSICLHEYGHAAMAFKLGDDTAARDGHLSLNPLIQMKGGALVFLFLVGLAWGMVPVNPAILRRHKYGEVLVSFAGPAMNLMLFLLSGIIVAILLLTGVEAEYTIKLLWQVSLLNAALFLLNMLPIPTLDGWNIYEHWVPAMRGIDPAMAQQIAFFAIFAVLVTPLGNVIWTGADQMAGGLVRVCAHIYGSFV